MVLLAFVIIALIFILVVGMYVASRVTRVSAETAPTFDKELRESLLNNPLDSDRQKRGSSLPIQHLQFEAYDCSVPYNLTSVTVDRKVKCDTQNLKREQGREKTYLLLQKARRVPLEVTECVATYSRIAYVCSSAGHSTMIDKEMFINKPYVVSEEQCRKARDQGIFDTPHNEPSFYKGQHGWDPQFRKISKEGTSYIQWPRAGATSVDGHNDIDCEGSRFTFETGLATSEAKEGDWPYNDYAVVVDYLTFTIRKRSAYLYVDGHKKERLIIDHNQLELPLNCHVQRRSCVMNNAPTYLWTVPSEDERCPLFKLRTTKGVDVISEDYRVPTTYISEDNTMVRLEKRTPAKSMCGAVVTPTEYDQLYLTEDLEHHLFQRPLPPSEGSPFLYANQKLHYSYEKLADGIEDAVLMLRTDACKRDQLKQVQEYANRAAEQRSVVDGDTVQIEGSTFATAKGEIWWVYKCRPLFVTARPTPDVCFDALPVTLSDDDLVRVLKNKKRGNAAENPEVTVTELEFAKNLTLSGLGYFLEPRTHRLLTAAVPDTCIPHLPAKYKNSLKTWIAYQGEFFSTIPPQTLSWAVTNSTFKLKPYYPDGGIYSGETVRRLEEYQQARRLEQGMVHNILKGVRQEAHQGGGTSAEPPWITLVPGMPSKDVLDGINVFAWFWKFVKDYGYVCNILVGSAIMFQVVSYALGFWIRLCSTPRHPNILLHILSAFFPSVTERLTQGRYRPRGNRGPCAAMTMACFRCRELDTPDGSLADLYRPAEEATQRFQEHKDYLQQEELRRRHRQAAQQEARDEKRAKMEQRVQAETRGNHHRREIVPLQIFPGPGAVIRSSPPSYHDSRSGDEPRGEKEKGTVLGSPEESGQTLRAAPRLESLSLRAEPADATGGSGTTYYRGVEIDGAAALPTIPEHIRVQQE